MRRSLNIGAVILASGLLAAAPAGAQGRHQARGYANVPPGHRPPAGLCRVWIDGVPPGRQPGVTDCAYAYSHVPANGRVIYGGPAPQRSYARNRAYAPYYYGAPTRSGDPNGNYIQRTRDRLNATRAQQLRSQQLSAEQLRVQQLRERQLRERQLRERQGAYTVRGSQYAPVDRADEHASHEKGEKTWKHEKEHGHGNGHGKGHDKHDD